MESLELLGAWLDAAVCCCDENFRIVAANSRYASQCASEPVALTGASLETLAGPDNWALLFPYLKRVLAGEHVRLTAGHGGDGAQAMQSEFELRPWLDAPGDVRGAIIAIRETAASEGSVVPDAAEIPHPMALLDENGRCQWSNAALHTLLGPQADSLVVGSQSKGLGAALAPTLTRALAEGSAHCELQYVRPGSDPRWMRFDILQEAAMGAGVSTRAYLFVTDVQSQRGARDALERSERYFRAFSEISPEAVTYLDRQRCFRYANRTFLEQIKMRPEEVIGRTYEQVLGAARAATSREPFERALGGEIVSVEASEESDGKTVWREVRYLPLRMPDGRVDGVYVASHSIDEHKRAQGTLREQSTRGRVLTDNLPAQVSYLGADRRFRYVNYRFLADNALSESEVIGRTPLEVFGPEIDAQLQQNVDAAVRGERVQFERRSSPRAPDARWWRVSVVADHDENGELQGTYGIAVDITEARLAQERLLQQQQWIESFIENFPQALGYVDPTGIYRYANRAFAELLGQTRLAVVGSPAHLTFPSAASDGIRKSLAAACSGEQRRSEHEMTLKGVQLWIAIEWLPDRDERGALRGLYTLAQDVSDARRARFDYERSVQEMQRAMDSVAMPISFVDGEQRIRFVNHTSTIWYGRRPDELIGLPLKSLLSEEDYGFATPYIEAALAGQSVQYEREMRYHDGIRRWVLLRYVPTKDDAGKVNGFYTTATDIQARKQQELALQQANWLLTAHFENTPLASFTLDADDRVTRWSSQAEKLFGWHRDEVLERPFWRVGVLDERLATDFFPKNEARLGTEPNSRRHIAMARRRDGQEIACEWHIAALRDAHGRITSVLSLVQDISQRVETEKRLIEIAQRDTLTKLLNRNALEPTLNRFIERARIELSGVAVLFIDLDHFKNINDTLGHRVGDLMLIEIASILRRCVRAEDEVARIGGDEFMVIVGHQRPKAIAHETAQRIIHALRDPIRVENQRLQVAASIGVAVYPDHGHTPEALLRSADLAMYKAKDNGKDRFEFFSASLAQHSERRSAIKTALRLALQRDTLKLYYQPRVGVADGQMAGAEALLRWNDPRLGPIGPKEFINIAEESGLIHELGLYVFRKACQQIRDWQDRGVEIGTISVNFSAHQLLVATFIDEVDLVLEQTGCDPRAIEVEITETSMLFDLGVTKNVITDLKHRGMRIAIDDFGTGYSSLSHLQQLEIDTLKIDQGFIRDMLDDASDFAITRSVISLGAGLGLSVTAEGVENEHQLNALREAGCDHYQGFYFSPAVVVEDFEVMIKDNGLRALTQPVPQQLAD